MASSPVRAAGLVVFRRAPAIEFLLLQASYPPHHWTPPKGHVDPGEDEWTAALRETKEEANIDKEQLAIHEDVHKTLAYEVKGKPKTVKYWAAQLKNPEGVTLSHEHQNWKSREDAFLPPIAPPSSSRPVKVHAALDTSFVMMEDGKLFSFGLNEDGQCPNGEQGIQTEAREVRGDSAGERLVTVSASTDSLMAVEESGRLFVWGQNEYGQTGEKHAGDIQLLSSRCLSSPSLQNKRIVVAGATATTCVAATEDGTVFTWGVGVLGLGPDSVRLTHPTPIPQTLFDGRKVLRVHAGNVASAAVNEEGNIFVWGQNRYGLLGLGHTRDQLFPFPLFFQEDVKQISMGPDQTLVVVQ